MSRAVSVVETCASSPPTPFSQPWAKSEASRRYARSSAGVSGVGSTASAAWVSLSLRQRTPSLAPTPRGSQLTRSYRSRSRETVAAYPGIPATPDAPGPPKLNRSEPMRSPPRALERISARSIVSPSGFDQSSGTFNVAHCQSLPGGEESAVALQRSQSSFCEVSAAGSAFAPVLVGLALPERSPPAPPPDEPPLQPAASSAAAAVTAAHRTKRPIPVPLPPRRARATKAGLAMVGRSPDARRDCG